MPSPFPGVDPYLEAYGYWPDFHHSFIVYCGDAIMGGMPERYVARIRSRLACEEIPEGVVVLEHIREPYLEIVHLPDRKVVTIVDVLSPSNKVSPGREDYQAKRELLLTRGLNLVELDLLICGTRSIVEKPLPSADYFAYVSRASSRLSCEVYAWNIREPFPNLPIPLQDSDPDTCLDLASLFDKAYERGRYDLELKYKADPPSFLRPEDREWARAIAQKAA